MKKKHHIADTKMNNNHLKRVGKAIQNSVNTVKVMGPFPISELREKRKQLTELIEDAIESQRLLRNIEDDAINRKIDTRAEYKHTNRNFSKQRQKLYEKIKNNK